MDGEAITIVFKWVFGCRHQCEEENRKWKLTFEQTLKSIDTVTTSGIFSKRQIKQVLNYDASGNRSWWVLCDQHSWGAKCHPTSFLAF